MGWEQSAVTGVGSVGRQVGQDCWRWAGLLCFSVSQQPDMGLEWEFGGGGGRGGRGGGVTNAHKFTQIPLVCLCMRFISMWTDSLSSHLSLVRRERSPSSPCQGSI